MTAAQQKLMMSLWEAGGHSQVELAELFGVARSTIQRTIARNEAKQKLEQANAI